MRASKFVINTLKETPSEAETISHQLMLRAGMIKMLASGLYTWTPLGTRVYRKIENIVREEMNKSGALEIIMPMVQPAELWEESGRWVDYGPELLRFPDRHGRSFCLGPTHEEVVTDYLRSILKSYKQLPLNLYQIQTKFRDEIRPRFGLMRAREFTMKDAYSFNMDDACLEKSYRAMHTAYSDILSRIGLDFRAVRADGGSIGGSTSQEFHVLAKSGEDAIVVSSDSDYAANMEVAEAVCHSKRPAPSEEMSRVHTPNEKTIAALVKNFDIPIEKTVKTLIVNADDGQPSNLIALLVRGDHQLNAVKAEKLPQIAKPLTMASEEDIALAIGAKPGSLGPVGLPIPLIVDRAVAVMSDFSAGANEDDWHYFNINWGRDVELPEIEDIRNVTDGDPSPDGKGVLQIKRGIEVGHIFMLGDKYSKSMQLSSLDKTGKPITPLMGCYGIGVSRLVPSTIEQFHDEKGIIWPMNVAPFEVVIVPLNAHKDPRVINVCNDIYSMLLDKGVDVLLDDRDERPGVKFAELDLIGIPHRLVISPKLIDEKKVEHKSRVLDAIQILDIDEAIALLA